MWIESEFRHKFDTNPTVDSNPLLMNLLSKIQSKFDTSIPTQIRQYRWPTLLLKRAHSKVLLLNIFWKCDMYYFFAFLEYLGKFKNFEPYFLFAYFQMYKSTFNNNTVEFHTQCLLLNLALPMNWTLSSAKWIILAIKYTCIY